MCAFIDWSSSEGQLSFPAPPLPTPGRSWTQKMPPVLVISHLRWDFVWQRPQHLLSRASAEAPVLFIEEPIFGDESTPFIEKMERLDGAVCVVRPHLNRETRPEQVPQAMAMLIARLLLGEAIEDYILWAYTPAAVDLLPMLHRPKAIVFDVMDELSAFRGASPALLDQEKRMLEHADVVFTGGLSLFEAKRHRHANIYCFPSSIDHAHFAQARMLNGIPNEYADTARPRLGFYGVIDERFDIELLRDIAALRPAWQFIILGPVVKIDTSNLPQSENIYYLGGRSYEELPHHLAAWDVALLLFARNESTRFISPTKTPEYLSAGKPTVSTPITDVVHPYGDLNLVHIAESPPAFVEACELALAQRDDPGWLERVDNYLANQSWDDTWHSMRRLILAAVPV